jgi:tRNA-splicing ligase RtcB
MPIKQEIQARVPIKLWTDDADRASLDQLRNIAALPFVFKHVAAMPDVHLGVGATVGSVVATKGAVVPAAVGVDIGCGMAAISLPFEAGILEGKLPALRSAIERVVPVGFSGNDHVDGRVRSWARWADFAGLHPKAQDLRRKAMQQLGSLGGGNHFIEVCLDTANQVWLLLHSGSRNIGKSLAEMHINEAKHLMKKLSRPVPHADLAYFEEGRPEYEAYLRDLHWAQDYAAENRRVMLERIMFELAAHLNGGEPIAPKLVVNCHHNYASVERHFGEDVLVTRKGAVRAGKGDYGLIPGSMGTRSYVVRGRGNPESFESCSHGAGRRMSRSEAKRRFTVGDLARETQGVECRKDAGVLDEIPSAYKPIEKVMADQSDLVEVVAELKQVLCVKG